MSRVAVCASVVLIGACLPLASHAACDSKCQSHASSVADHAAQKLMLGELGPGGKLGGLIRAEVGLEACGAKGKSEAVAKLRKARFDQIVKQRIAEAPIGSATDSTEERIIQAASFLSTAQALLQGYALGYEHSTNAVTSAYSEARTSMCEAYSELGDKALFGGGR